MYVGELGGGNEMPYRLEGGRLSLTEGPRCPVFEPYLESDGITGMIKMISSERCMPVQSTKEKKRVFKILCLFIKNFGQMGGLW